MVGMVVVWGVGWGGGGVVHSPNYSWVGPPGDSAVQTYALLLPHGVGARLNHKLWGMHQAVLVHALVILLVFMNLKTPW